VISKLGYPVWFDFALKGGRGGLRAAACGPAPAPASGRGLATAEGHEAETKKHDEDVGNPMTKKGRNRGGEGPRPGRHKLLRNRVTAPFAAKGRVP
jgi:hypothetical protein